MTSWEMEDLLGGAKQPSLRVQSNEVKLSRFLVAATSTVAFASAGVFLLLNTHHINEKSSQTIHRIPKECSPYVQTQDNQTLLNLYHGKYIFSPDRKKPYDLPCFIMKDRYNCMSPEAASPDEVSYHWHFVLQSNLSDIRTRCDLTSIVDEMGGPAAVPRDRFIGLIGNSYLRQLFESLGCKYKHQLTKLFLSRSGSDKTEKFLFDTNNEDKFCFGGSTKEELQGFYSVPLPDNLELVPNCDDNLALAEYSASGGTYANEEMNREIPIAINSKNYSDPNTLSVFYNFRPHYLKDPSDIFKALLGNGVMQSLDTIFWNDQMQSTLTNNIKKHIPNTTKWVDISMLMWTLINIQKRDAGVYFQEDNPWVKKHSTSSGIFHPCMPGIPEDEIGIFLFILIFDLDGILTEDVV